MNPKALVEAVTSERAPGRVPWNRECLQFKWPLWDPHGNSGLADGTGQSDTWGILRAETHLKSDGTHEKH